MPNNTDDMDMLGQDELTQDDAEQDEQELEEDAEPEADLLGQYDEPEPELAEEPEPQARRRDLTPEQLPALAKLGLTDDDLSRLEAQLDGATAREWLETMAAIASQTAMVAAQNEFNSREIHTAHLRRAGVTDEFMNEFGVELRSAAAQLPAELRGTEQGARIARAMAIEARIAGGEPPEAVYRAAAQASKAARAPSARTGPPVSRAAAPVASTGRAGGGGSGRTNDYEEYLMRTHGYSREEARAASKEANK